MEKKYELTHITKVVDGRELRQIRAIRKIGSVYAGELGGFIEREYNLSHFDLCWIWKDACAYGNSEIRQNAEIYGRAKIYGNARIYDCARVNGDARIHGHASVGGTTKVIYNAEIKGAAVLEQSSTISTNALIKTQRDYLTVGPIGSDRFVTAYKTRDGVSVAAGCFFGTLAEFRDAICKKYDCNSVKFAEYVLFIDMVKNRWDLK